MTDSSQRNPFLYNPENDDQPRGEPGVEGWSVNDLRRLRSEQFAELPFAIRLDQLLAALPRMNTGDVLELLLDTGAVSRAFLEEIAEKRGAPVRGRVPAEVRLVACVTIHLQDELDRRIPPRER